MSADLLSIYRAILEERFAPELARQPERASTLLTSDLAARLEEALIEGYAEPSQIDRGHIEGGRDEGARAAGLRLAVGVGVDPARRLSDMLGDGGAEAALAVRLGASAFGSSLFSGAGVAMLISDDVRIVDPVPSLLGAARRAPSGWSSAVPLAASAIAALSRLAPLIDAGAATLTPSPGMAADPAIDLRATAEHAASWAGVVAALSDRVDAYGDDLADRIAALTLGAAKARASGADVDPLFQLSYDGPASDALFAAMAASAGAYDLRVGEGGAPREAVVEARWGGWSNAVEDAPRLDAGVGAVWRVDLGAAPDPTRLPLEEAVALRLGDEGLAERRAILAEIADAAQAHCETLDDQPGAPPAEALERLEMWRRLSAESAPKGRSQEALGRGWRARATVPTAPLPTAAAGLAELASAWPETALIAEFAADAAAAAQTLTAREADAAGAPDVARASSRRVSPRGGSVALLAP